MDSITLKKWFREWCSEEVQSQSEFRQWATAPVSKNEDLFVSATDIEKKLKLNRLTNSVELIQAKIVEEVAKLLDSSKDTTITLNGVSDSPDAYEFSSASGGKKWLYHQSGEDLTLNGGQFEKVCIHASNDVQIHLNSCHIHTLEMTSQGGARIDLTTNDCRIGTCQISSSTVSTFVAQGGCVLNFQIPTPDQENPFTGSVLFDNVEIPHSIQNVPLSSAQPYRNLKAHLNALQNYATASTFHIAEQAVDLELDHSKWNKFFGLIYRYASNSGSSPGRPLGWLLALSFFSVALLGFLDGVVVQGDCAAPVGWYASLCGEDGWARLSRGFVMGVQPISFFGALLRTGSGYSLIASNVCVQAWLVAQSLMSGVLLTLFILALRRRFKLGP